MKNPHPWNEADNATRVRYIFTEFMFGKIREGYSVAPKYTPAKMQRDLAHEEIEHTLFDTYSDARYSGGNCPIPDEKVKELDSLVSKKKRKNKTKAKSLKKLFPKFFISSGLCEHSPQR